MCAPSRVLTDLRAKRGSAPGSRELSVIGFLKIAPHIVRCKVTEKVPALLLARVRRAINATPTISSVPFRVRCIGRTQELRFCGFMRLQP
jgi:hypothetical protein